MPTSTLNFNFLAQLFSEIWRGSQNKKWGLLIPKTTCRGQIFFHVPLVPVITYQRTNFQLPNLIDFGDIQRVPK